MRRKASKAYAFFLRRKMVDIFQATAEGGVNHEWWPQGGLKISLTVLRQPSNVSEQPSNANLQGILDRHNEYRCMHGVAPLRWNDAIAQHAAKWAKESGGRMVHSSDQFRTNVSGFGMVGENLAWGTSRFTSKGAVDVWHKEIKFTDNGTLSSFNFQAGHYTALIWKTTTDVGCAVYKKLLVCQYGPIGNTETLFTSHVLPITKTASECGAYAYKRGMIVDEGQEESSVVYTVDGKSLSVMIGKFIDEQSDSTDNCHSQMVEAKQQLNQLTQLVADTFTQINALENQSTVAEAVLQEKLKETTDLDNWRDHELAKCQKAKEDAVAMYAKLRKELQEMKQISSPGVSMDVANGNLHKVAFIQEENDQSQGKKSFTNQRLTAAIDFSGNEQAQELVPLKHHVHSAASYARDRVHHQRHKVSNPDVGTATVLVTAVHKASLRFHDCVRVHEAVPRVSLLEIGIGKPEKNTEECEAEKAKLEEVYVKAYV
jgi:hypothetical protein